MMLRLLGCAGREVDIPIRYGGAHLSVLPYSRSCLRALRILTTTHIELRTAEIITATDCTAFRAGISSPIATHLLGVGSSEATGDLIFAERFSPASRLFVCMETSRGNYGFERPNEPSLAQLAVTSPRIAYASP
jgi:hypothetical protein